MKTILFYLFLIGMPSIVSAQINWLKVLPGTWKVEQKENFEHWDILTDSSLKGFSYSNRGNTLDIAEYLALNKQNERWLYEASVIGHNNGRTIKFNGETKDSTLSVTNPTHDFPKLISYKYINENKILVSISDAGTKSTSYFLERQTSQSDGKNTQFDEALAKSLGADSYGMKSYFLVILNTGKNSSTNTEERKNSFAQHLKNIQKLVEEQKLVVAGPIAKNDKNYRGIFIFHNLTGEQELRNILQSDLAIKNNYLDYTIYTWYGSAALPIYLETALKISKEKP